MLNFIDLFAGAGGLSEGFIREGFEPIAHVEMKKEACNTLKTRTSYHYLKEHKNLNIYREYLLSETKNPLDLWSHIPNHLIDSIINKEISDETIDEIFSAIDKELDGRTVDIIVGGPPCQAYSIVGRARDPKQMKEDPRNYLFKYYIQFLSRYRPKMFVFENVTGLLSANGGKYLRDIFNMAQDAGYELQIPPKKYLNAKDFDVLQNRKRVIIIGWKKEYNFTYPYFEEKKTSYSIMPDLFCDLPFLNNGEGTMGLSEYINNPTDYLLKSKIRNNKSLLTQHLVRPTNDNDLEIYKIAVEMWNQRKRLNYAELPSNLIKHNNTKSFTNRFQVVDGEGLSHTVVAHIAMDGHYYIHPDIRQNRSISVREAARIQSFPDDYFFEGSRTAVLRQIGNAVPVLMAEGIAKQIKTMLLKTE